jgi:hypothetical protein
MSRVDEAWDNLFDATKHITLIGQDLSKLPQFDRHEHKQLLAELIKLRGNGHLTIDEISILTRIVLRSKIIGMGNHSGRKNDR